MANLVEQVRAAESVARARAAEAYRAGLARMCDPRPGDAEMMMACMRVLGKTFDDVEADTEILSQAAALEIEVAKFEEADRARIEAAEKALAHAVESERLVRERQAVDARLAGESAAFAEACRRCGRAAEDLRALCEEHRALFGLPEPQAAAAPPINLVGLARPASGSLASGVHGGAAHRAPASDVDQAAERAYAG